MEATEREAKPTEGSPSFASERKASYGDYLRAAAKALQTPLSGPADAPGGSPLTGAASPATLAAMRGASSPGDRSTPHTLVVKPDPTTPAHAVTCQFTDAFVELDGFELEEAAVETCRCCSSASWVTVQCFHQGSPECACDEATWDLCEPCCEKLEYEVCLSKQVFSSPHLGPTIPMVGTTGTPSTEVSSSPDRSEEAQEGSGIPLDRLAAEGIPGRDHQMNRLAREFVPMDQRRVWEDTLAAQEETTYTEEWYAYEEPVPTLAELQMYGYDLSQVCVEFAATQNCPRGPACRWIHCTA